MRHGSTRSIGRRWAPFAPTSSRVRLAVAVAAVLGGVAAAVAIGSANGGSAQPAASGTITVSPSGCAPGWVAPHSGRTEFTVANTSGAQTFGVDLVGGDGGATYGEIDMLAPGTRDTIDAVLRPGRYEFQCEAFAGYTLDSRSEQVTGPPVGDAHPYVPVNADQIQIATLRYNASLSKLMTRLERDTDALGRAVTRGDLPLARMLWLPAHLDYERLGAAYDTFGNFDTEIDGKPLGLAGGVRSPHFQGFLRLEYGLWHGQPAPELAPVATRLDRAVHGLVKQFPQLLTPANDLSLRTHEILENTLQFDLTGALDEGSHTTLAAAWANVRATELALHALAPLLRTGEPKLLGRLQSGLVSLGRTFAAYRAPSGRWAPLGSLTEHDREQLDSRTSGLLEQLDAVPDILELPIRPSTNGE